MSLLRNAGIVGVFLLVWQVQAVGQDAWIATWASSPQPVDAGPKEPLLGIENQTVRERVRVSVGGERIRIRFSNEYGSAPLVIGSAAVGVPVDLASVKAGSVQAVTFGGSKETTIAAGAAVLSDAVAFRVPVGGEISVSIYFPKRVVTPTLHAMALKRAVVSKAGDFTGGEKIEGGAVSRSSISVTAVLVPAFASQRLVVAFGDSVMDGDGSTVDADDNWPNDLRRRLAKMGEGSKVAVVNEGIGGNRLLSDGVGVSEGFGTSGLSRFDRDALGLPGVTHVVVLEGINDLAFPGATLGEEYLADPKQVRTAEELIDGYRQLIARAHARGVKVIGVTMSPFEGVDLPGYYSEAKDAIRQEVNRWIRTSGAYDGVIDFEAVLHDPGHRKRILAKFAYEDHLHPNAEGYRALAEAVDLSLFK
jgi:lysophospholipase L1-like esterase